MMVLSSSFSYGKENVVPGFTLQYQKSKDTGK